MTPAEMRAFALEPLPKGQHLKCRIVRYNTGSEKLYPRYDLLLEIGEGDSAVRGSGVERFLMSARKRKKSRSSNYLVCLDKDDLHRDSPAFVSKLRANFVGTQFVIYDNGDSPRMALEKGKSFTPRVELGAVNYEANVLGFKGPRKMTVLIPSLRKDGTRARWQPVGQEEAMMDRYRTGELADMWVLTNKQPVWNEDSNTYVLNFHGRVTRASVKNFQLIHPDDPNYVVMQFGRVGDNTFTCDFQYPLCPAQAFSLALSSFDSKLACE